MENLLKDELMAFIPQYVANKGNCTVVYTKRNKPVILERNIRTFIRLLCNYYMFDLRESRKRYSHLISYSNMVPIALSREDIFIPLKTRKPMYKNDGATGYINMKYIKKISEGEKTTIILLSNDTSIECLCSKLTVNNHIKDGSIVSRCFEDRVMSVAESEIVYDGKRPIVIVYRG